MTCWRWERHFWHSSGQMEAWIPGEPGLWVARSPSSPTGGVSWMQSLLSAQAAPALLCLLQKPHRAWDAQGKVPRPTFSFSVTLHLQQGKFTWLWGPSQGWSSRGTSQFQGGPQCSPQAPGQDCSKVGVGCFCHVPSQKGERPQVTQGSFRLDIRKNVFTGRVVSTRDKFPRELVESLSLEVIKRCLDVALGDRV